MATLDIADCINDTCPWSGKPVAADSLTTFDGKVVGFCNTDCRDKFEAAIHYFRHEIYTRPSDEPNGITNVTTSVTKTPAAIPADAFSYFSARLRYETDCWDVHESLTTGPVDFVLLDVRSPAAFAAGHIEGAVNLPHAMVTPEQMSAYPLDTTFVVYCAGPHCNGANKAAVRLAHLGLRVKEMIGGITGWKDEGFPLVSK